MNALIAVLSDGETWDSDFEIIQVSEDLLEDLIEGTPFRYLNYSVKGSYTITVTVHELGREFSEDLPTEEDGIIPR